MSAQETTRTEPDSDERGPRWGLIGLIAAATIVIALIAIVGFRALQSVPRPPLGETAVADLQLGSCLAEGDADLGEYTVVECGGAHPQQVVGPVDLSIDPGEYSRLSAMTSYAQAVCDRFIEYGLYLRDGVTQDEYALTAMAVPTEDEFADGRTTAYCAVSALDGSDLTEDLYRPVP